MAVSSRRLVAIMFTDIAGYTDTMGKDEAKALLALESSRRIVSSEVERHGGTVLDRIGDGTLSSFDSAVAAVDCAREIQERVASEADFELRIGIHIGDVIVSESGVVGDGVNVASRIHGLADPGSICISERVYDDVRNQPEISAIPLGEQRLKNVNRRVTVYVIAPPGRRVAARTSRTARRRRLALAAGALVLLASIGVASGLYQRALVMISVWIPLLLGDDVDQEIGFVTSRDGTRIAYAVTGEGPAMLHVLGWLTHLERGFFSPTYSPDVAHWSKRFRYVRYDGRGAGLSDRGVEDFSLDARIADLEAVIDGLGLESPILYGLSAGGPTCIGYTAHHPERVRALILVSTAASGDAVRKANPVWNSLPEIMRSGWGQDNAAARQVFTSLLAPEADPVVHGFINELIRVSMTGEDAGSFFASVTEGSVSDLLNQIRVPTLIIHASGDLLVPIEAGGRELAAGIPGSRLVVLETNNHGIPSTDPQYPALLETVDGFLAEVLEEPLR